MTTTDLACPRCKAGLELNWDELICLHCGYVDYGYEPPKSHRRKLGFKGTQEILRYNGLYRGLYGEVKLYVEVARTTLGSKVIRRIACPVLGVDRDCGLPMIPQSLSGKRRDYSEERYKCDAGHRVSIFARGGTDYWR